MTAQAKILHLGAAQQVVISGVAQHFVIAGDGDAEVRGIASGPNHLPLGAALFDRYPKLEILASFGVGYDHIDAKEAARRGIVVTHTPDVLSEDVADIALALLLNTVRELPASERYLRAGLWEKKGAFPLTSSLRERSVGILGYGRIGKEIHKRLKGFGVPVSYTGRHRQDGVAADYYPDVVELAKAVDTLIIAAPGGPATKHLVGRAVLEALGPRGIVINIGRGSVVDEAALAAALAAGTIAGVGLDVFEDEPRVHAGLLASEKAVLLPHVGSASHFTRNAMGQLVVDNLVSWFKGKGPITPVPETPWRK